MIALVYEKWGTITMIHALSALRHKN